MTKIIGASVSWSIYFNKDGSLNIAYDNDPSLNLTVDEFPSAYEIPHTEVVFPGKGRYAIGEEDGFVHFVFESKSKGMQTGALGGVFPSVDGGEIKIKGGWSSRAASVNIFATQLFGDYVIDVTLYKEGQRTGRTGFAVLSEYAIQAVNEFIPEVELVVVGDSSKGNLNQEQSEIIYEGSTTDSIRYEPKLRHLPRKCENKEAYIKQLQPEFK